MLFLALLLFCCSCFQKEKKLSTTVIESQSCLDSIIKIDFKSYFNLPIDSLLKNPLLRHYTYKRVVCEPTGCLWYLTLIFYSEKLTVDVNIYPTQDLRYIPQRCINYPKETWDMNLLGKETILKAESNDFR